MTKKQDTRPVLVVAGPGSGKTYGMVDEIVKALGSLSPNRFLAAITYTNAAADSIRTQLGEKVTIPPNIFVGTNHSFLIRFIIRPFAPIFQLTTSDCLFMGIDPAWVEKEFQAKGGIDEKQKARIRKAVEKRMVESGKVPFEQVAIVASRLLQNKCVRANVSNRLQYLFVDEFQDVDTSQYGVFDEIRKAGKTQIYAVGDPEQYISGFTYRLRHVSQPRYSSIPFFRFASHASKRTSAQNRRSCEQIVTFTNRFHGEINQISHQGIGAHSGVYFFTDTDLDKMVTRYRRLTESLLSSDKPVTRMYLSYEKKTFGEIAGKFDLVPLSNDMTGSRTLLAESLKLISTVAGQSQQALMDMCGIDHIELRKLALQLLRDVTSRAVTNTDELCVFVMDSLQLPVANVGYLKLDDEISLLQHGLTFVELSPVQDRYSTIHKAKGLQADAVLVVAETKNRLRKWLTVDKAKRYQDKQDECRIGFVGFSRAKEILCIACLQSLDGPMEAQLHSLEVQIKPTVANLPLFQV